MITTTTLGYSLLKMVKQCSCTNMYTPLIEPFLPRLAFARYVVVNNIQFFLI